MFETIIVLDAHRVSKEYVDQQLAVHYLSRSELGGFFRVRCTAKVHHLENGAFAHCIGLKSIHFSANLKSIGMFCFAHCFALQSVECLHGLKFIGPAAFYHCINIRIFMTPSSVLYIGPEAVKGLICCEVMLLPDLFVTPAGLEVLGADATMMVVTSHSQLEQTMQLNADIRSCFDAPQLGSIYAFLHKGQGYNLRLLLDIFLPLPIDIYANLVDFLRQRLSDNQLSALLYIARVKKVLGPDIKKLCHVQRQMVCDALQNESFVIDERVMGIFRNVTVPTIHVVAAMVRCWFDIQKKDGLVDRLYGFLIGRPKKLRLFSERWEIFLTLLDNDCWYGRGFLSLKEQVNFNIAFPRMYLAQVTYHNRFMSVGCLAEYYRSQSQLSSDQIVTNKITPSCMQVGKLSSNHYHAHIQDGDRSIRLTMLSRR